ncbi:hypothetical protein [Desulfomicrobium escambiense]|uniref:hypothetical protein n=1 Tax=Desulfomicrobium escambiense TaxID=29503 RepID=UPI0012EBED7E|nr:hypothetical protein [Desulfomicrobium escambiense]
MAFETSTTSAPLNPFAPPLSMPGSTGGPGCTPPSNFSLPGDEKSQNVQIDVSCSKKEQHNYDSEILEVMIGGSGGIGGIPTSIDEALAKDVTPSTVMNLLKESVSKMSTNEKLNKLLDVNSNSQSNITKAQKYIATVGLQTGVIANLIKKDVLMNDCTKKAWTIYRRKNLDKHIHPNTLAVYMNIAEIDNVEEHLHLGIDRLGKFARVIEKKGMINDKDPIKAIIDSVDHQTMAHGVAYDFTEKCEAAILHHRVKKAGLNEITLNDILSRMNEGNSLDKKDIDKMVGMKERKEDYRKYFVEDIDCDNQGNPKSKTENNVRKEKKVKDVNAEIEKLHQTVHIALAEAPSKINLDFEKLDILINTLLALRQTLAAPKDMLKL